MKKLIIGLGLSVFGLLGLGQAAIAGDWQYFGKNQEGQEVYLDRSASRLETVGDRIVIHFQYKLVDKNSREVNRTASTYDCNRPDGQKKGRPTLFDVSFLENGVTRTVERKAESDAMRNMLINACRTGWASVPSDSEIEPSLTTVKPSPSPTTDILVDAPTIMKDSYIDYLAATVCDNLRDGVPTSEISARLNRINSYFSMNNEFVESENAKKISNMLKNTRCRH